MVPLPLSARKTRDAVSFPGGRRRGSGPILAVLLLLLAGCATAPKPVTGRIVDREGFIAALPARAYVVPHPLVTLAPLADGLQALGAVPVELVRLPGAREAKRPLQTIPPEMTSELRNAGGEHFARFLLLINSEGKPEAIWCYRQSDTAYARAAGAALLRWEYAPATIDGANVPMLLEQSLTLSIRHHAGHPH